MKHIDFKRLHKNLVLLFTLTGVLSVASAVFDARESLTALTGAGWHEFLEVQGDNKLSLGLACVGNGACRPVFWERFKEGDLTLHTLVLAVAFGGFFVAALVAMPFANAGPEEKDPGGGKFAGDEDLKPYLVDNRDPDNPRKGHYGYTESGKQLRAPLRDRCTHLAIFAGTGGGKTTRVIKPSLIQDALDGTSVLMVDPKWPDPKSGYSDLLAIYNDEGYEVQVFCPFEEHTLRLPLIGGIKSHDDAEVLASTIIPKSMSGESEGSQFYRNQERELLKHLLWGEAQAKRGSIGDIYDLIDGGPAELSDWVAACSDPKINRSMTTLLQQPQHQLIGIIQGLKGSLSIFTNERLDAATQSGTSAWQNLSPKSLTERKSVLYVGIPQQMFLRGEGKLLLNLFFRRIMDEILSIARAQGGSLKRHLSVYIDEFAHIGRLEEAGSWFGTMRSYNIAFTVALQNRAQLELVYGTIGAKAMEGGNFQHLITFPAALKGDDKEYVSKLLGEVTAEEVAHSKSWQHFFDPVRHTETRRRVARPLLSVEDMNKWNPDYGVLLPHGAGPTKIAAPMIHQKRVGRAKNGFYRFRGKIGLGDSLALVENLLVRYKLTSRSPEPPEPIKEQRVAPEEALKPRTDVYEALNTVDETPTPVRVPDDTPPKLPESHDEAAGVGVKRNATPTKTKKKPAKTSSSQKSPKHPAGQNISAEPSPSSPDLQRAMHNVSSGELMQSFRAWVEGLAWREVPITVYRVREGGRDRISKVLFERLPGALRHEHLEHWKQRKWIQIRGKKLGLINSGCTVLCPSQIEQFLSVSQAQVVEIGDDDERVVVKTRTEATAPKEKPGAKETPKAKSVEAAPAASSADAAAARKHVLAKTITNDRKIQNALRAFITTNGCYLYGHPSSTILSMGHTIPDEAYMGRYIPEVFSVSEDFLKGLKDLPDQAITSFTKKSSDGVSFREIPGELVRRIVPLKQLATEHAHLFGGHPTYRETIQAFGKYQEERVELQKDTWGTFTDVDLKGIKAQPVRVGEKRQMRCVGAVLTPESLTAPSA